MGKITNQELDTTLVTKLSNSDSHIADTNNPHGVTASQVGAEPVNANIQTHISSTSNPHGVTASQVGAEPANANIQTHISSTSNPHAVTATQIGLGNVTNESKATMFTSPTFTGTVALNGGQIKFPATQVPSSDANTLDDYEEGTWTPSVGGTATYSTQTGTYIKIGRLVHVSVNLTITSIGTGSQETIYGLPFTATGASGALNVYWFAGTINNIVYMSGHVTGNSIALRGIINTPQKTTAILQEMTSGTVINGSMVYYCNN